MSTNLSVFQKKIGATPDGSFGPDTLKKAAAHLGLTKEQAAHFFGQCSHESAGFTKFIENLNYSAKGLRGTFSKYFPTQDKADQYARQPAKIANYVYANRMGNGPESSGDGWKYRGAGAIQLTGKTNYQLFAKSINQAGVDFKAETVAALYAFESAKFFFDTNSLWSLCKTVDDQSIKALTKRINGGTNGLAERISLTKRYYNWLV